MLVGVSARSLAGVADTVTLTQFRTLVVLSNVGAVNLNRLADVLEVTPSTAMRMIGRLWAAGLVTRKDNPANRREVVLGLTAEGRGLVREVTGKRGREIARIVTAMPAAQRRAPSPTRPGNPRRGTPDRRRSDGDQSPIGRVPTWFGRPLPTAEP